MSDRKKNSILIVDDERANISLLKTVLSTEYTIYASSDGQNAIETANEFLPDVILLDIIMPEMDGYEVIATLKKSEKTRDIPVIFITGLDNADAEKKGLGLGAADYIPKPFNPDIVKLRVQNQLKIINNTHELDERLRQQTLVTEISHNFIIEANADSLYADTLHMIGEFMGIATALLYMLEDNDNALICRSEWLNPELNLKTRIGDRIELKEQTVSHINNLLKNSKEGICFCSNDPSLKDLIVLTREYISNYIGLPVFIKGEMCAVLAFSRKEDEWEWSKNERNLIFLVADMFSGIFERAAMERQYSIVENSPNLILYITADANLEYVNPAVSAVTGYTQHELIEKGLSAIFDEKVLSDIKEKHIPDAMRGGAVQFESDMIRKDGEKRIWMLSVVQTGKNNLGIITSDLTEIRELEAGLIIAKEHAEYSNRAKGEFLSRMSHEMKTPMNTIIGMMQVAKSQGIPNNIKEYCNEINVAANHLMGMISDILDLSGIGYEMFKLSDSIFDFNTMMKNILQAIGYNASQKKQELTSNIDLAIPVLLSGDERCLKQVVVNLLANAVKFTPEHGKINLDVSVLNEDDKTITLQINVADNGVGISKEHQSKLFDVFEQVDGSDTRKHEGIGIGLALSKRIIELMGGNIWIESELGKGAKFYFTCKLKKIDD